MSVIPVTLSSLIRRITESENLQEAIETYRTAGFAVDSWLPGGGFHTLTRVLAKGLTVGTDTVQVIAKGGYLDWSTGNWLTLLARSWFGLRRREASYTIETVTIAVAATATPQTIVPGQLWVTTATGKRFNNTAGAVIAAGSSAGMAFKAESPGASYNAAPGTITGLVTPIPGVTVTGNVIATAGMNAESDPELRTRCRLRWATLSALTPGAAYEFWALTMPDGMTARDGVTRAYADIDNPEGAGTVHVYLAGPAGPVDAGIVTAVDTDLRARRGISTILTTSSASALSVSPTGSAWVYGVDTTTAEAEAELLLDEMLASIPIGGRNIGGARAVFRDEIEATIRQATGIVRVSLGSGDHTMTATQVAVGAAGYPGINFTAA